MEKKEEFLTEIRDALARGYCTKENEKKVLDFDLIYAMGNEIEVLISQELDKAREDVLIELQKEFSEFGVPDDVRYTQPLFYINEVIEKKLSKLKNKEDGK